MTKATKTTQSKDFCLFRLFGTQSMFKRATKDLKHSFIDSSHAQNDKRFIFVLFRPFSLGFFGA